MFIQNAVISEEKNNTEIWNKLKNISEEVPLESHGYRILERNCSIDELPFVKLYQYLFVYNILHLYLNLKR